MSRVFGFAFALVMLVSTLPATAQSTPPSLTGTWTGKVTADIGEMKIELTVTATGAKATGQLQTAHGTLKVKEGTLKDGVWTLTFTTDDGGSGVMKGKLTKDSFAGDWDFRPMAVGTFTLARRKT